MRLPKKILDVSRYKKSLLAAPEPRICFRANACQNDLQYNIDTGCTYILTSSADGRSSMPAAHLRHVQVRLNVFCNVGRNIWAAGVLCSTFANNFQLTDNKLASL